MKRALRITLDVVLLLAAAGYLYLVFKEIRIKHDGFEPASGKDEYYRLQLVSVWFYAGLALVPWWIRRMERRFPRDSLKVLSLVLIPLFWALATMGLFARLYLQPLGQNIIEGLNFTPIWLSIGYGFVLYGVTLLRRSLPAFWAWILPGGWVAVRLWSEFQRPSMGYGWIDELYRDTHRALPLAAALILGIAAVNAAIRARNIAWKPLKLFTVAGLVLVALLLALTPPNPAVWPSDRLPYIQAATLLSDGSLALEVKKTYLPIGIWEDTGLVARSSGETAFRVLRRNRVWGFNPDSALGPLATGSENVVSREMPPLLTRLLGMESEINLYHLPDGSKTTVCAKHWNDFKIVYDEDCPIWLGPGRAWMSTSNGLDYSGRLTGGEPFHYRNEHTCRMPETWSSDENFNMICFNHGRDEAQPTTADILRINWGTGRVVKLEKNQVWGSFRDWASKALDTEEPVVSLPDGSSKRGLFRFDEGYNWVPLETPAELNQTMLGWDGHKPLWFKLHPVAEALGRDLHCAPDYVELIYDRSELRVYGGRSFLALMDTKKNAKGLYEVDFAAGSARRVGPPEYRIVETGAQSWRYTAWLSGVQWLGDSIVFVEHGEFGQRVVRYFPKTERREILLAVPFRKEAAFGPADLSGMM